MVPVAEFICGNKRVFQNIPALLKVIRPGIGECLEQAKCHNYLADTSDILPVVTTVLCVTRVFRFTQIQYGNTVTGCIFTQ